MYVYVSYSVPSLVWISITPPKVILSYPSWTFPLRPYTQCKRMWVRMRLRERGSESVKSCWVWVREWSWKSECVCVNVWYPAHCRAKNDKRNGFDANGFKDSVGKKTNMTAVVSLPLLHPLSPSLCRGCLNLEYGKTTLKLYWLAVCVCVRYSPSICSRVWIAVTSLQPSLSQERIDGVHNSIKSYIYSYIVPLHTNEVFSSWNKHLDTRGCHSDVPLVVIQEFNSIHQWEMLDGEELLYRDCIYVVEIYCQECSGWSEQMTSGVHIGWMECTNCHLGTNDDQL